MTVLDLYPWLTDVFADVTPSGRYVDAACPLAHERPARKLRFWLGSEGCLCLTCWAGCPKLEVLRAVGRGWKDCFPGGVMPDRPRQQVTARYRYTDEGGALLYETVRLEPGWNGRDKDFRQRRPDPAGRGGWSWGLDGVRRVLYRLPDLLAAPRSKLVVVAAGEKDCDSLHRVGVVATTNVCGERAPWLDEYSACLAGRDVLVIEDADAVGRRHANEVVGSLTAAGVRSVRRCRLPGKDATGFLNGLRAGGVADPEALRRALWQETRRAPQWVTAG